METHRFLADFEACALWLYEHNLEQSESFADLKFQELEAELSKLRKALETAPRIGAHEPPGMRRFPIYEGRFSVVWFISEAQKVVTLVAFNDLRFPMPMRTFRFED